MRCTRACFVVVVACFGSVVVGCGPSKVETLVEVSAQNDCSVDDECCVVEEPCSARAFLVTADEFDAARDAAEFDEGGTCNTCSIPTTTAACVDGRCQGTSHPEDVTLKEGVERSSCGPRDVVLREGGDASPAVTFEQFFGCDGLNQ